MSDDPDMIEDDADQPSWAKMLRQQAKATAAENKALKDQLAATADAQRELAILRAGVDTTAPGAKYFLKGYDGEMTPEAIMEAAKDIPGLLRGSGATQNASTTSTAASGQADNGAADELDRVARAARASNGGVVPDKEAAMEAELLAITSSGQIPEILRKYGRPVVDPFTGTTS